MARARANPAFNTDVLWAALLALFDRAANKA
jgi:hypothetical protein